MKSRCNKNGGIIEIIRYKNQLKRMKLKFSRKNLKRKIQELKRKSSNLSKNARKKQTKFCYKNRKIKISFRGNKIKL